MRAIRKTILGEILDVPKRILNKKEFPRKILVHVLECYFLRILYSLYLAKHPKCVLGRLDKGQRQNKVQVDITRRHKLDRNFVFNRAKFYKYTFSYLMLKINKKIFTHDHKQKLICNTYKLSTSFYIFF